MTVHEAYEMWLYQDECNGRMVTFKDAFEAGWNAAMRTMMKRQMKSLSIRSTVKKGGHHKVC